MIKNDETHRIFTNLCKRYTRRGAIHLAVYTTDFFLADGDWDRADFWWNLANELEQN